MANIIDEINDYVADNLSNLPNKPVLRLSPEGYQAFMDIVRRATWDDLSDKDHVRRYDRITIESGTFDIQVDETQGERFRVE